MGSSRESAAPSCDSSDTFATSRSLLERVRIDDSEAWNCLIDTYAPLVYRWCARWGLAREDVEDVVQEVFRAVSAHIKDFRKLRQDDTFRGWLRTITNNKLRDQFRTRLREPRAAGGTEAQSRFRGLAIAQDEKELGRDSQGVAALRVALNAARAEFENRTWEAFWLTAVEDKPAGDVGVLLEMSAGAVRVAKARVLRRLRELLPP